MVSFLSRAKPETLAAITRLRISRLSVANFADFDSFDIVFSCSVIGPELPGTLVLRDHHGLRRFDSFGLASTASHRPQQSCFTRLRLQWIEHARTNGSTEERLFRG